MKFGRRRRRFEMIILQNAITVENTRRQHLQMLAGVASDLADGASAVQGHSELLLSGFRGELTEPQADSVQRIQRAGTHIVALVASMHDFARFEMQSGADCCAVKDVIRDVTESVVERAHAQHNPLSLTISETAGFTRVPEIRLKTLYGTVPSFVINHTPAGCPIQIHGHSCVVRLEHLCS